MKNIAFHLFAFFGATVGAVGTAMALHNIIHNNGGLLSYCLVGVNFVLMMINLMHFNSK